MDKVKIKVIGVLRERGGAVNVVNRKHQVGVGVSPVVNGSAAAQDNNITVNGNSNGNNNSSSNNNNNSSSNQQQQQQQLNGGVDTEVDLGGDSGGVGGGGGSGAARTSILQRPQVPKLSALDLAGILNTRRRLEWTKEWLRKNQTEFLSKENILSELQFRNNENYHLNYFLTITESQFRFLVQKLEPEISQYAPQRKKKSFSAEERLAITLKYLATGEVHSCRNYCFRASKPVIFRMIANICYSFYTLLKDQYLQLPKTDEQWQRLAANMQNKHELANCVGSLFMREIQFHNTANSTNSNSTATVSSINNGSGGNSSGGSNSNSSSISDERKSAPLIFSGIVDSDNNFLHVDVEYTSAKAHNDMYEHATMKEFLEKQFLPLSSANNTATINNSSSNNTITNNGIAAPTYGGSGSNDYYFIGENTLPTKKYLITAQNASVECSKNLDAANTHIENTLRILCNIFPILAQPMRVNVQHTRDIVLGCIALYNFLRKTDQTFHQRTDNIVKQPWEPLSSPYMLGTEADEDDDCIMLASEEELRERAEFTPSIGLTTCFQKLAAQIGETADGAAKRDWLMRQNMKKNGLC